MKELNPGKYQKHHSFHDFKSSRDGVVEYQKSRAIRIITEWLNGKILVNHPVRDKSNFSSILKKVLSDLLDKTNTAKFKITSFIAEEMYTYSDQEILRFFYHRYRYDVYPSEKLLDEYPPYLQIEPSSLCNYRCVFCYQTDTEFFKKSRSVMGFMSFEFFCQIIDEISGHVEFLSLASRGEPMMAKDITKILNYAKGKFLNLKVNTNASLLTEEKIHALLSGGVKTVVFSADAAVEPLYSQLRVNGKLEKVLKNVELFHSIREREYKNLSVITRVSGVKVDDSQDIAEMQEIWGKYVDQIAFVNYNPWENVYNTLPNGMQDLCSDLFRRMFIWQDGSVNPCDTDYKSTLSPGRYPENSIKALWNSEIYNNLREAHLTGNRQLVEPCRRCSVI